MPKVGIAGELIATSLEGVQLAVPGVCPIEKPPVTRKGIGRAMSARTTALLLLVGGEERRMNNTTFQPRKGTDVSGEQLQLQVVLLDI